MPVRVDELAGLCFVFELNRASLHYQCAAILLVVFYSPLADKTLVFSTLGRIASVHLSIVPPIF